MVREDGSFVRGPGGGGGDEGNEGGGHEAEGNEATRRSTVVLNDNGEPAPEPGVGPFPEPFVVEERVSHFNASNLKGRPLI